MVRAGGRGQQVTMVGSGMAVCGRCCANRARPQPKCAVRETCSAQRTAGSGWLIVFNGVTALSRTGAAVYRRRVGVAQSGRQVVGAVRRYVVAVCETGAASVFISLAMGRYSSVVLRRRKEAKALSSGVRWHTKNPTTGWQNHNKLNHQKELVIYIMVWQGVMCRRWYGRTS